MHNIHKTRITKKKKQIVNKNQRKTSYTGYLNVILYYYMYIILSDEIIYVVCIKREYYYGHIDVSDVGRPLL